MKHQIQWTTPSPLWENAISQSTAQVRRAELSRPAILRFATDSFMDDFMKLAENDPKKLGQYIALPETWRGLSPIPEAIIPAPAFARNFKRLGLISARKKAGKNGLTQTTDKFKNFANSHAASPLKLYQPAHQRFYMISACLVCERPGLPDKIPNSGREEKVSYVIRRLFPQGELNINKKLPPLDASWEEYAYVLTDQGAKWKKVSDKNSLVTDEEQLTLFSVNINEDDGRRRKIFAGVIPTGRREAYMAAGKAAANISGGAISGDAPMDSRVYVMRSQFRDPWKNLLQSAAQARKSVNATYIESDKVKTQPKSTVDELLKNSREQIQTISWLILLDFANYLAANLPRVWQSLNGDSVTLNAAENTLKNALINTKLGNDFLLDEKANPKSFFVGTSYSANQLILSLKDALLTVKPKNIQTAAQIEKDLENVAVSYDRKTPNVRYPKFLFPFADPVFDLQTNLDNVTVSITPSDLSKTAQNKNRPENSKIKDGEDHVNRIAQLVEAALPPMPANQPLQMPPLISQTPMDMRQGWFVIRCVYERPLCGTIDPPVLSEPTEAFQIAGFFDPDAPARPIRIALPIDTSPAGLRKFDKNTAFMMSDLLCGQVNRMKGITFADLVFSILPFPFHKSLDAPDAGGCEDKGLSVGMMCSLSIPIITICALILLMIIVALLDFIFKWLPFLIFCFPLPGLKAKDE
ncbi:MAG: hypothetical protein ABIP06_00305 [Pyrinomonadaceae bacterium]